MTIWQFHCKHDEYAALNENLKKNGWIIAAIVFSRGEWHITGVSKQWLFALSEERRERVMQRLAYEVVQ